MDYFTIWVRVDVWPLSPIDIKDYSSMCDSKFLNKMGPVDVHLHSLHLDDC